MVAFKRLFNCLVRMYGILTPEIQEFTLVRISVFIDICVILTPEIKEITVVRVSVFKFLSLIFMWVLDVFLYLIRLCTIL